MDQQQLNKAVDNSRESILNRLEGVLASKVIEKDGVIEEVHVLVDKSRSPKQVSRDIQSTFVAWFGESLDHRKISVAQLEGFQTKKVAIGRVTFERMVHTLEPDGKMTISVTLSYESHEGVGEASAYVGKKGRLKLAAEATLLAMRKMLDLKIGLTLEDVQKTTVGGEEVVNAAILLTQGVDECLLIGAAFVKQSDLEATVKATLDAVNRRLPQLI